MEIKRTFLPGDQWLYLKLYSGRALSDQFLGEILYPIFEKLEKKYKIKTWFFIRYRDLDDHIRLRFKTDNHTELLKAINQILQPFVHQGLLWNMEVATYNREIERYRSENIEVCEVLFSNESKLISSLLHQGIKGQHYVLLVLSLVGFYLDLLIDDPKERINFLSDNFLGYKAEFNLPKLQLKELNRKYRELANNLEQYDLTKYAKKNLAVHTYMNNLHTLIRDLYQKQEIASSLIHMFVNRFFHSNARAMELVVYHHLEKHYRSQQAKTKYIQRL
jgi:thiopeptide-type bacteriocin biosynthesis protein